MRKQKDFEEFGLCLLHNVPEERPDDKTFCKYVERLTKKKLETIEVLEGRKIILEGWDIGMKGRFVFDIYKWFYVSYYMQVEKEDI